MSLKFYNTLTNSKQQFTPVKSEEVRIYNCGPTVYDYAHIGNFRTFVFEDLLRRYLEYKGYKVRQVMNITDVGHLTEDDIERGEDKIQKKARERKLSPSDIARFYEQEFKEQFKQLNLKEPAVFPRATENIQEMQEIIKVLLDAGFAYEVNGSVYYNITRFKEYGRLSGNTVDKLEEGRSGRDLEGNKDKKNFYDFSLWVNDPDHLMWWKSPWSERGYPGWHIECSVMSMKYLSSCFNDGKFLPDNFETIDIHTGGEDNIFPHHEAEIAQTKGATGKDFANFWMHSRHLIVDGEKMSKSLGNFYTLKDLLEQDFQPLAIRYLLLSTHYRKQLNFTFDGIRAAATSIERIHEFIDNLQYIEKVGSNFDVQTAINSARDEFEEYMDDDLNISPALGTIFTFIKETNKELSEDTLSKYDAAKIIEFMRKVDMVLGIGIAAECHTDALPAELSELINEREQAREDKDWGRADEIRDELEQEGLIIKDTREGTVWKWKE